MPHIASLQFVSMNIDDQGTAALHFRPRRPLGYLAGQHGLWLVPRGGVKPFTVASAPEEEFVTLGTSLNSQSRFKRALVTLAVSSTVRLFGPIANFSLDRTAPTVVMLAQGIGVTPFRSMLRHQALSSADRYSTLIHVGAQHPFRGDTEPAATEAYYPTSHEAFIQHLAAATVRHPDATFMISGTPAFVRSTAAQLKATSIESSQIRRDAFYGWSGS
ncbi:MAG: Flavodoxin reductases (ferredoxin-NADPH reductases) family 1 [uncultured Truepera sp.]|uniref:Flavodoxin reductases (Ferredoxin-NADPH reductases) family 1 n=1 Tax=uncultured Truepera sp. TaxID=543023 RepID=A0A6J4VCY2_9DEIN|nr:MAG: Flavodoxin reductases (ferredoxin-NADPH reductases) family 1 [uncultured Truepera sp.]